MGDVVVFDVAVVCEQERMDEVNGIFHKGKHVKECYSVSNVENKTWNSAWVLKGYEFANKFGNKTPKNSNHIMFVAFRCNCTFCDAELWVNQDRLLKELPSL